MNDNRTQSWIGQSERTLDLFSLQMGLTQGYMWLAKGV
jgi:hypothetical protein